MWITGASSGIGEETAVELSRRGSRLALTARRAERLEEVAKRCGGAIVKPGDVSDLDTMLRIGAELREEWGRIDVAMLNAGTWKPVTPDSFSSKTFREEIDVNYMGVVHGIEAVLQPMRERRGGRIVIVASVAGLSGLPMAESYGATKAALITLGEALRGSLAPDGVAVTVVEPGFVRTRLTEGNDFNMPFMIEVEEAARRLCDGLEKGKPEIAFPTRMALTMRTLRHLPGPARRALVARIGAKQRT